MIKFENIILRTIDEIDIDTLFVWSNCEFRGDFQEFTFESKKSIQKEYEENGFCSGKFIMLMVECDNKRVGLVYINFIREGIANIGIVIQEGERGKNIGSKVTTEIVKYLFENYNIVRIEADTDVENVLAQKVLKKSGFCQEGILKKYRYHHGKYNDSIMYSIVR